MVFFLCIQMEGLEPVLRPNGIHASAEIRTSMSVIIGANTWCAKLQGCSFSEAGASGGAVKRPSPLCCNLQNFESW